MPLAPSAVAESQRPGSALSDQTTVSFEERWAAWEAKGAARDRAFRRKMAIASPVVIIIVALIFFVLLR